MTHPWQASQPHHERRPRFAGASAACAKTDETRGDTLGVMPMSADDFVPGWGLSDAQLTILSDMDSSRLFG